MAVQIPFRRDFDFEYVVPRAVSPLVRRVVARNPGPFTFAGTGTYIVGHGTVAVIDPGPELPEHLAALLAAVEGETVSHILVTHCHLDHSPLSRDLAKATGAPVWGLARRTIGDSTGEAGGDSQFRPDREIGDGTRISGPGWNLEALHTPGHASEHLCYALAEEATIFTGDHIMGWSTSVISPPDGDMAAYVASLERIMRRPETLYRPTHGAEIIDGPRFTADLLTHRHEREAAVLEQMSHGPVTIPELVTALYIGLAEALKPAAGRSVSAHLVKLIAEGRVSRQGETYRLM